MQYAIYGCGPYGESFYRALTSHGLTLNCFIDQYTSKKTFQSKPILKLENVNNKDIYIYISVALTTDIDGKNEIVENLRAAGFKNIFDFSQSIKIFRNIPKYITDHNLLWMKGTISDRVNHEKLNLVKELLHDKKSKEILKELILFRETLSVDHYTEPDKQIEYFPKDIDLFSQIQSLKFVDVGSYTGDTVHDALHLFNKKIDYIYCLEPDKKNLSILKKEVAKQQKKQPETLFFINQGGAWSKTEILPFTNDGNSSSHMASISTGKNIANSPFVALDDLLLFAKPNYIKLDIEGTEKHAIKGAINIIKEKPILAICLYHKPEDLWELPLLIHNINQNYKMYLRVHGHMNISTVLYCV